MRLFSSPKSRIMRGPGVGVKQDFDSVEMVTLFDGLILYKQKKGTQFAGI